MSLAAAASFGAGGSEPYAHALNRGAAEPLYLRDARSTTATAVMDVSRWSADADEADLSLLTGVRGPVLDIGCGPGRMVRAARDLGIDALGIDVSRTAVRHARRLGGVFAEVSVFGPVPRAGTWQTALIVDGNIGIGGDVAHLLARAAQLLRPGGELVVELDGRHDHEARYTGEVVDARGRRSASFPWAEIGRDRIAALLPGLRLGLAQHWTVGERSFCRLAKLDS